MQISFSLLHAIIKDVIVIESKILKISEFFIDNFIEITYLFQKGSVSINLVNNLILIIQILCQIVRDLKKVF